MQSAKLMCLSVMTGLALLAMPLGSAAQQQQEYPRLPITDNSESRYSTTTSVAPQNSIDDEPAWPGFRSSTKAGGTWDLLKEYIFWSLNPSPAKTRVYSSVALHRANVALGKHANPVVAVYRSTGHAQRRSNVALG